MSVSSDSVPLSSSVACGDLGQTGLPRAATFVRQGFASSKRASAAERLFRTGLPEIVKFPPLTPVDLHGFISTVLGFYIPRVARVPGHSAPFDYLCHAFFEPQQFQLQPRDCIVWANRGGGKTQLGAIATLLDMLFKPGIQIRILGGSFEQSSKMHAYLKRMLEREPLAEFVVNRMTQRRVELINGSCVQVLSQSERAVRGQRVHRLRCDEVELFEPEIWEAAQFITRSGRCGDTFVQAGIEALSTMHKPHGMMHSLLGEAAAGNRKVFRWSVLDTLEQCPPARSCNSCMLWSDCGGIAKLGPSNGYVSIDDALQQKSRVGRHAWDAEMLCEKPDRTDSVYPEFDRQLHVFDGELPSSGCVIAGIDFGYAAPTALLLAMLDDSNCLHIVDEFIQAGCTTQEVIAKAAQMQMQRGKVAWIAADPAGHSRSDQTGRSTIWHWKQAGWRVRTCASDIASGVQLVRARLRSADGSVKLRVHRRCSGLIHAISNYRYRPASERTGRDAELPVKDGSCDHACDALRYLVVNMDRPMRSTQRRGY